MTIDPDVARIARQWAGSSESFPRLIQSVVNAEGGGQHIVRAVQCSIPSVKTRDEAIEVLCRSAVHAMSDWTHAHAAPDVVAKWAERWAPQGAENDPHNLNANWPHNVLKGWLAILVLCIAWPLFAQDGGEDPTQELRASIGRLDEHGSTRPRTFPTFPVSRIGTTVRTHACTTGTVALRKREADRDWHLRISDGKHFVVAEIIPEFPIDPPALHTTVKVCGITRFDKQHGWYELHPVLSWHELEATGDE